MTRCSNTSILARGLLRRRGASDDAVVGCAMATERVEITFAARSRPTPEDEAGQYARDKRAMEWAYPKEDGIAPPTPWWRRFPGVEVGDTLADTLARHLRERAAVVEEASPTRIVVADGYERVLHHLDEYGHCFDRTMRRIADGP